MYPSLLLLLTLPFLAFGQSTSSTASSASNSGSNSASSNSASASGSSSGASSGGSSSTAFTTITSTSLSTFVGIVTSSGSRVESTIVSTSVFITVQPVSTGNSSSNNNSSSSSSSSTTTTPKNLPTAPTDVNGGGQGGAPVPGAKTGNGALGPDDNYIAAAAGLATKALLASAVACVVGGALVLQ